MIISGRRSLVVRREWVDGMDKIMGGIGVYGYGESDEIVVMGRE
jgi:hypothetical protein